MRRMWRAGLVGSLAILAFVGFIMIGRSSSSKTSIEGRWVGTIVAPVELGGAESEVLLWFTDNSHYIFRDGCNSGGAEYELDGSKVMFDRSGGSSTAKGCPDYFPVLPDTIEVVWGTPSHIEIPGASGPLRLVRVTD